MHMPTIGGKNINAPECPFNCGSHEMDTEKPSCPGRHRENRLDLFFELEATWSESAEKKRLRKCSWNGYGIGEIEEGQIPED